MSRIAYANGRYRPIGALAIPVEDRGLQFADGVYEVVKALGGHLCDLERHLDRLQRSLAALAIPAPMSRAALARDHARGAAAQRAGGRGRLRAGRPRRGAAQSSVPARAAQPVADRHGAPRFLPQAAGTRRGRGRCHPAGSALEALRHQIGEPAGQRPGAAGRRRGGMPRSMAVRRDGPRDRRLELERLHRRSGWPADHAPARAGDPGRGDPRGGAGAGAGSGHRGGRAAVHHRRGVGGARGVPDQHLVAACCR